MSSSLLFARELVVARSKTTRSTRYRPYGDAGAMNRRSVSRPYLDVDQLDHVMRFQRSMNRGVRKRKKQQSSAPPPLPPMVVVENPSALMDTESDVSSVDGDDDSTNALYDPDSPYYDPPSSSSSAPPPPMLELISVMVVGFLLRIVCVLSLLRCYSHTIIR